MSVDETLRKEAWEEAGIPPALLGRGHCASVVRVEYSVPEGLHREILFVARPVASGGLPPAEPGRRGGAPLLPVDPEAIEAILAGEFTLDAGAVTVDALLRNGVLAPEDPQYLELVRLLRP